MSTPILGSATMSYDDALAALRQEAKALTARGAMTSWCASAYVAELQPHGGVRSVTQAIAGHPDLSTHLAGFVGGSEPPWRPHYDQGFYAGARILRRARLVRSQSEPWVWSVEEREG